MHDERGRHTGSETGTHTDTHKCTVPVSSPRQMHPQGLNVDAYPGEPFGRRIFTKQTQSKQHSQTPRCSPHRPVNAATAA